METEAGLMYIDHFSNATISRLRSYVYIYSDPITGKPFYVGKGKGDRVFDHLSDTSESEKARKIQSLRSQKLEPLIEILVHGVDDETALKVEAAAIDLIGIENLTNRQRGYQSSTYGKIEASMLEARYNYQELCLDDFEENAILIRINQVYRNDMNDGELYDATRSCWKINIEKARNYPYVMAVYDGIIMEVYRAEAWLPAGSTMLHTRKLTPEGMRGRYEFVGSIADESISDKYKNKLVSSLFRVGDQNPIRYVKSKYLEE